MKGKDVGTGPAIEWQAQDGRYRGAPTWPLPGTETVAGGNLRTDTLVGPGPGGGDGPADGNPAPDEELGSTAAREVVLGSSTEIRDVLGLPEIRLRGAVTGLQGYVFLELVDVAPDGTRVTVDDQVMPVALPGGEVDRRERLHGVSWRLRPGHRLELELTTGSSQYSIPRTGPYSLDLTARIWLPIIR